MSYKVNIALQVKLSNEAKDLINKALDLDMDGKYEPAFDLYLTGIDKYKQVLNIKYTREELAESQQLTQRIVNNIKLAHDRAEELREIISRNGSNQLKKSTGGIFSEIMDSISNVFFNEKEGSSNNNQNNRNNTNTNTNSINNNPNYNNNTINTNGSNYISTPNSVRHQNNPEVPNRSQNINYGSNSNHKGSQTNTNVTYTQNPPEIPKRSNNSNYNTSNYTNYKAPTKSTTPNTSRSTNQSNEQNYGNQKGYNTNNNTNNSKSNHQIHPKPSSGPNQKVSDIYPELRNIEPKFQEMILNEVVEHKPNIKWSDIQGLEKAKKTLKEVIILPSLRPELFTGLRAPPKGVLFFGPPGCGKTLLAKAVATESQATFFSISASSLTSKYLGDSEKLVRALFAIARVVQPSIIFIDEIDSILSQRGSSEHEASRRLKTEFLIQLDGATTQNEERIVIIAATNLPGEIDEAARRRLTKRIYIPLPDFETRKHQIKHLLSNLDNSLTESQLNQVCKSTEGYSGSDITSLCKEAAMGPLRNVEIMSVRSEKLRPINLKDFNNALEQIRPSVSKESLVFYDKWNQQFGSL